MKLVLLLVSIFLSMVISLSVICLMVFAKYVPFIESKVQYLEDRLLRNMASASEQLAKKQEIIRIRDQVEDSTLGNVAGLYFNRYTDLQNQRTTTSTDSATSTTTTTTTPAPAPPPPAPSGPSPALPSAPSGQTQT